MRAADFSSAKCGGFAFGLSAESCVETLEALIEKIRNGGVLVGEIVYADKAVPDDFTATTLTIRFVEKC